MVKFYRGCLSAGVQPIVGADVWWGDSFRTATPLTLLVQNQSGYLKLSEWLTAGFLDYQKWLSLNPSLPSRTEGLIALSGGLHGAIGQL